MTSSDPNHHIQRFSSRRQRLDQSFLRDRLRGAKSYDRIAGFFRSSLIEVAGEELESVTGNVRLVCNSDLRMEDVQTARAAAMAVRKSWSSAEPEKLIDSIGGDKLQIRFRKLFQLLSTGKLEVRVLPDEAFGLVHGKAGVIHLNGGGSTSFLGSVNESMTAWKLNYELMWEDSSTDAVKWVQEEFDALWGSPAAIPLADAVVEDIERLSERKLVRSVPEWIKKRKDEDTSPDPAPALIETPVFRKEVGLWEHQKYFVKLVMDWHHGPMKRARFVLADQVGLGKTLQLAMSAMLIALTGDKPILIICPKTLVWQWQGEMRDLLAMPSAVWDGRNWIDENGLEHPSTGPESIRKCPRKVGIVSSGLITHGSHASNHLLNMSFDCVILDEAHRARRKNLGPNMDGQAAQANRLLAFMQSIAPRARSLLLATATPVQLRPIEAWDLLDVLARDDQSVLGNDFSVWRRPWNSIPVIMRQKEPPNEIDEMWDWIRNPMPPKSEHKDFEVLRGKLDVPDSDAVVPGSAFDKLRAPDRSRVEDLFPRFIHGHNPYIRRIVRRTREQLENQIDPETNEPLLQRVNVELLGEGDEDAIRLPPYLREAYKLAEEFCEKLGERVKSAGFLRTGLLRRVGSTIYAGMQTAARMLETWDLIDVAVVVDIFNRVNSGGTKLSKGDLTLAKICAEWPDARAEMKKRLDKWRKAGYVFKLDWFLRNINAVTTGKSLFSAMKDIDSATFKNGLDSTEKVVDRILNLIASRLGLDHDRVLGSRYSVPLMSRYLQQRGGKLTNQSERDQLLYWYVHTMLWGRYSASTESVLATDLEAITAAGVSGPGDALKRIIENLRRERSNLKLNESDFAGSSKGNRFYPLLYMMTRVCHARDWGSGDELTNHLLGHMQRLEIHHVFPKALLYKHGFGKRQVNAIANFTFLTKETNLEISDADPSVYLPTYESLNPGVIASHWMPTDPELWKVENYPAFLAERRKLLAAAANSFLDSLYSGAMPGHDLIDDQSFIERAAAYIPGGIADDEEEAKLVRANKWVVKQGLAEGELDYDLFDTESGQQLAVLDLAWPTGLQEGLTEPVALLIDEDSDVEELASQAGFRFFTSVASFRRYVKQEILGQIASSNEEAESEAEV